jgi:protoporphyrinogen oxidase
VTNEQIETVTAGVNAVSAAWADSLKGQTVGRESLIPLRDAMNKLTEIIDPPVPAKDVVTRKEVAKIQTAVDEYKTEPRVEKIEPKVDKIDLKVEPPKVVPAKPAKGHEHSTHGHRAKTNDKKHK